MGDDFFECGFIAKPSTLQGIVVNIVLLTLGLEELSHAV
jgi:hypothetical protein